MIKNLEKKNSDLNDWEKFLEDPGRIHDKDNNEVADLNSNKKFRFDFHGYSIEKANSTIDKIISKCYENGVHQILVITGKGIHSKNEFDAKDKKQFLKGAEIAYETILTSFSKGDKENLKTLLTEKMQNNFSSAIEDRKAKKIKSELTFIGIKSSAIENFEKTAEALYFTVKFVSEIISVKKDKDNKVVEGDPNKIRTVIDHWKFTKKISSSNPNWYLAEIKNS